MPKENKTNTGHRLHDEYWCECKAECDGVHTCVSQMQLYWHNPRKGKTAQSMQLQRIVEQEEHVKNKALK
jgi:hypothetical protein